MDRVKKIIAGSYSFTATATDEDGEPITVIAPTSAIVRDGAGVQVASGTPTITGTKLSLTVASSALSKLDQYSIEWTAQYAGSPLTWETHVEIVGGFLFEIAAFRSFDSVFANTTRFPTATIRTIRTWVEDIIEGELAAAVAFVPRGRRASVDGSGRNGLPLPDVAAREVLAVSIDGTAWSSTDMEGITVDDDLLWLDLDAPTHVWRTGRRNVVLHYTHGLDRPPGAITRAALLLAKEYAVQTDVPSRATATSIGDQLFRITVAGRDGVTGIPDVDAAIAQFGRKRYRVG